MRRRTAVYGVPRKITNCQIGVFAAYVSRHGHAFIDRALYLPKSWTDDPVRLKATYVPDVWALPPSHVGDADDRARHRDSVPFRWVAADTVYGVGDIEQTCAGRQRIVLGVDGLPCLSILGKNSHCRHRCGDAKTLARLNGSACRQEKEPKGPAYMTGVTGTRRSRSRRIQ